MIYSRFLKTVYLYFSVRDVLEIATAILPGERTKNQPLMELIHSDLKYEG